MATTAQIATPVRARSPLALWHLLSLDAPTVAALWTWFIASSAGIHLPLTAPLAMALAVWIIYAADRLLDAHRANRIGDTTELEARHRFHERHRAAFATGIALAAVALGTLLPLLDAAALRLYAMEGALLAAWFAALHVLQNGRRLPKEIAVGIFFSAAVFIPAVARNSALRPSLVPSAALLAALCALNCLFIYLWEHVESMGVGSSRSPSMPHPTTLFALRHIDRLALAAMASAVALAVFGNRPARVIALACGLSIALLLSLDRMHPRLSRIHLRAAADLALLTPLLLLPLARHLSQ